MEWNFNFTSYNPFPWSQQAAESFKCLVYFRNYWGRQCSCFIRSSQLSSFSFHSSIFCVKLSWGRALFYKSDFTFFLFFPNQKVFYSNRRPFVERLPVAQIPKPRKIPSEERGHEQRTTHGRLARGFWRNSMTLHYYTKTIDVGRKSSSHLKWVHQWISFTRF